MIEKGGLSIDQNSEKFQNIYFLNDEMIGELDLLLGQVLWDSCPFEPMSPPVTWSRYLCLLMAHQMSPEADSRRANVT